MKKILKNFKLNFKSSISILLSTLLLFLFQNCSSGLDTNQNEAVNIDVASNCIFNGVVLENGEFTEAYLNSNATDCASERETRSCLNGSLSGSFPFASCSAAVASQSCLFNGIQIPHNSPVNAYLRSSVPSGSTCQSQTRVCNNGVLTGSYGFSNCTVNAPSSCMFNGRTIAHLGQVRSFLTSSVASGQACSEQVRTCNNGTLSGSYEFASCVVNAPRSCLFNGRTIPHLGKATAFLASSAESMCLSEVRTCNNGTLSGSYRFANCNVNAPNDCIFNGETISHSNGVTGFFSNTVNVTPSTSNLNCYSSGNSQFRICNDGTLSGTARFSSCTVNYAPIRVGPYSLNDGDAILLFGRSYVNMNLTLARYTNSGQARSWDPTLKRCIFQAIINISGRAYNTTLTLSAPNEAAQCNRPIMYSPIRNLIHGTFSGPYSSALPSNYVFPNIAPYNY